MSSNLSYYIDGDWGAGWNWYGGTRNYAMVHEAEAALDQPYAQQHKDEIDWLCEKVRDCHSVLEVGSCFGHTLRHFAAVLAPGARICSIDLGVMPAEATIWEGLDVQARLEAVMQELEARGFETELAFGNSHDPDVVAWAKALGPFDLVFIDAGHSYKDARADWENYGPLGRMVAFHDIAPLDSGVAWLWAELRREYSGFTEQKCIKSDMGIGLVHRALRNVNGSMTDGR